MGNVTALAGPTRACTKQLSLFKSSRLPHHPYCTEVYDSGYRPRIRSVDNALRARYIQPNAPTIVWRLVFDLDFDGAAFAYESCSLPAFSWSATNAKNGHAHVGYELEIPVNLIDASTKAARLLVSIERAIGARLNADKAFSGFLIKNPIHQSWLTIEHRSRPYSLFELAEWVEVELSTRHIKQKSFDSDTYVLGRNFAMFEKLRKWSYSAIRNYWKPNGHSAWRSACLAKIDEIWGNDSINWGLKNHSYKINERKATAKSVADWTWKNMTPDGLANLIARTHTRPLQQAHNKKSQIARASLAELKRSQALALASEGLSQRAIAIKMGVSKSSVSNYLEK